MSYMKCVVGLNLGSKIAHQELRETAAEYAKSHNLDPEAAMLRTVTEKLAMAHMEEKKIIATVRAAYEAQGGPKRAVAEPDATKPAHARDGSAPKPAGEADDQVFSDPAKPIATYYQFAGKNAATADTMSLDTAKARIAKKDSADRVRRETGWFRGVDGEWRFEIPDNEATLVKPPIYESFENYSSAREKAQYGENFLPSELSEREYAHYKKFMSDVEDEYNAHNDPRPLKDLLDHPKLFAAYPDLAKIQVQFPEKAAFRGAYYPQRDRIDIAMSSDREQMLSTLLHEIQHAIQHRENFATGGNVDGQFASAVKDALGNLENRSKVEIEQWKWANKLKIDKADEASTVARYGLMYESAQRLINYANSDRPSGVFRNVRNEMQWIYSHDFYRNEVANELQRAFYNIPRPHKMAERNTFIGDMAFKAARMLLDHVPEQYREQFKADPRTMKGMLAALARESDKKRRDLEPLNDLERASRNAQAVREAHRYSSPYDVYAALGGEVEARNTQARQKMSADERRDTSPERTQDTPSEKVVVMFGGLDIQAPHLMANMDSARPAYADRAQREAIRDAAKSRAVSAAIARTASLEADPIRRTSALLKLRQAFDRLESGSEGEHGKDRFVARVENLLDRLEQKTADKSADRLMTERQRGADIIREKLLAAKRRGDITPETADMADWFIRQNPDLVSELGLSLRSFKGDGAAPAGQYNPAARVMTLFKSHANDTTGVHEILHHLERLMPKDMQAAIRAEYVNRIGKLLADPKTTPEAKAFLQAALKGYATGEARDQQAAGDLLAKAPADFYQYFNPSEFWAVNATRLMERRYNAQDSVWSRIHGWLSDAVQKVRSAVGLRSDAPVLRALDSVMNGKSGQIERGTRMLSDARELNQPGEDLTVTETPKFKAWFSGSKVTKRDGTPLVVYHGTRADIESFKPGDSPENAGIFFTNNPRIAGDVYANGEGGVSTAKVKAKLDSMGFDSADPTDAQFDAAWAWADSVRKKNRSFDWEPQDTGKPFSEQITEYLNHKALDGNDATTRTVGDMLGVSVDANAEGANVVPAYLAMRNPLEIDGRAKSFDHGEQAGWIEQAKAEGRDGVIIRNYDDGGFGGIENYQSAGRHNVYIAFKPEQVKSAHGNNGEFDPSNPSILYDRSKPRDPVSPDDESKMSKLIGIPKAALHSAASQVRQLTIPISDGAMHAMAWAKDFANRERRAQAQWAAFDKVLTREFTREQLEKMWIAGDQENDLRRTGRTSATEGLNSLDAKERSTLELLNKYGNELWSKMRDAGMVSGDGVDFWTPRVAARIHAEGGVENLRGGAGEFSKDARNLKTSASSAKHRKYDTTAESEAALQAAKGEDAAYIKNIRVMPKAMAEMERALAGRTLINQIKAHGQMIGEELFSDTGKPNYVTFDHPALKRWQPKLDWAPADMDKLAEKGYEVKPDGVYKDGEKLSNYRLGEGGQVEKFRAVLDENGKPIMVAHPLYVRKDFYGPLKAVFAKEPNKIYQGAMALKGGVTSLIMISPLTHNMVIWGKALPTMVSTMGWKNNAKNLASLGLRPYFIGADVMRNHALMNELIDGGLVPVSGRGMNPDVAAIANGIAPGRSLVAKAAGHIFDLAGPKAGDMARKGIDKVGEVWHEKLLWERVANMQAGMAVMMRSSLMDHGVDQYAATRIATHFANRYAGMIPRESLSQGAHILGNLGLFSKTFTLTNIGAYKDMLGGLPKEVQAQIKLHTMEAQLALGKTDAEAAKAGGQALSAAQKTARAKGATVLALDIGAMMIATSLAQSAWQGQSWDDMKEGFGERLGKLKDKFAADPLSVLTHPFDAAASLSETARNPHGKEDRVRLDEDEQGNSYYARLPVGKIGEEMKAYSNLATGSHLLHNKMSTFVRPIAETLENEDFQGRRVYNPDDNLVKQIASVAGHWVKAQLPLDYLKAGANLATGHGDNMDKAVLLGTATGLSVSKVAGGDAVSELRYTNREQQAKVRDVLPDVREAMRRGDHDKAEQLLEGAGQTPREIVNMLKQIEDPSKISRSRMSQFNKKATDEQKDRLEKMR